MNEVRTGLQKAIAAVAKTAKEDPIGILAAYFGISRKTLLNWLREDGTPLGSGKPAPDNKVAEAIVKAGGAKQMAADLGVTPTAVLEWRRQGYMPAKRAQEVEALYGVPRQELVSPKLRSAMGIGGEL